MERRQMDNFKKDSHAVFEEQRLRIHCLERLAEEYGESIPVEVLEHLEKELKALALVEMSGIMLIMSILVDRSGLKRYELIPHGSLGGSLVAWLCGLTPFNPLKTFLPLYPEFSYETNWDDERSLSFSVPTGAREKMIKLLKNIEGVDDVVPFNGTDQGVVIHIIPDSGLKERNDIKHCTLFIEESSHIAMLKKLAEMTETDPEKVSFEDCEVMEMFRHADHPSCIYISPYRLTAIGLIGIQTSDDLEFYGNVNIELNSFADIVRVDSMIRLKVAWEDNQDMPVYFGSYCEKISSLSACVQSYCRMALAWRCAWYRLHFPLEFYRVYFENIAEPDIGRAVFSGDRLFLRTIVNIKKPEGSEDRDEWSLEQYEIDGAVAEEMYFRGIDILNASPVHVAPEGVCRVRELMLSGKITVLAGRPGMGKTSLACDLISITDLGVMPVYVTLYEETEKIIEHLHSRGLPCTVFASLESALDMIDTSLIPAPMMVIDYVPNDAEEGVREMLEKLHEYSGKNHVPVLVLSQVSRRVEMRKNKHPLLKDLPVRDCMELIDNVIMLYRESYYTGEDSDRAEAVFAKSPRGNDTVELRWDKDRATFMRFS